MKYKDYFFEKWRFNDLKKFAKDKNISYPPKSKKEDIKLAIKEYFDKKKIGKNNDNKEEEIIYYRFDDFVSLGTNLHKTQEFYSIWFYSTSLFTLILLLYLNSINYQTLLIHDFYTIYSVLFYMILIGLLTQLKLFILYKMRIGTYSNFYNDMKNYLMERKKIENKKSLQIIKYFEKKVKLIRIIQSFTIKKYFTIFTACLLLLFTNYIFLFPEVLLIVIGILYFIYAGELLSNEARKLLENYASFVYKVMFEEFYQFFNEISSTDFNKSEEEILDKLNKLVDLGLLKIFGKTVNYSKNLRSFHNKSNLQEMINLTYKFERVFEYFKNIKKTSSIGFDKIGKYVKKIRNELDYELKIVEESQQNKILSIIFEYIGIVLPIMTGVLYVILFFLNIFFKN